MLSVESSQIAAIGMKNLRTISGDVVFDKTTDYSDVCEITGSLYVRGADTKAAFPKNPKINDADCPAKLFCSAALLSAFASVGILFADGISAQKISSRVTGSATIHKVIIVGKTKISFVIERDGTFSHGATIAKAKESFIYKLSNRDTSIFKEWSIETKISLEEAIASYRAITGACEAGTRNFCEQQKLKKRYTVGEIIELTIGAYGHSQYKQFFQK